VVCADVWDCVVTDAVREFEQAVVAEQAWMGYDGFSLNRPYYLVRGGSSPAFSEDLGAGGHLPFTTL